jgi:hypothetical protein
VLLNDLPPREWSLEAASGKERDMSWSTFAVLVLISGYALYVAVLSRIAFGRLLEKPCSGARDGVSLRYILTDKRDDCDYDLLWHTQLPALEFLRSSGKSGVPIARMTEFFREFARASPELCDGSTFSGWLDALQSAEVAVERGQNIAITEKGLLILAGLEFGQGMDCHLRHRPSQPYKT